MEVGDWSDVYHIPLDSDFWSCIRLENEDAAFYEMHMYLGIGCLKYDRDYN